MKMSTNNTSIHEQPTQQEGAAPASSTSTTGGGGGTTTAAGRTTKKKSGRGHGNAPDYSSVEEKHHLIEIVKSQVPISSEEWQAVLEIHNEVFSHTKRDVNSIKRKFHDLANKKMPTGEDPTNIMPDDVLRKAKHVREIFD
jgi:hypothetical protein